MPSLAKTIGVMAVLVVAAGLFLFFRSGDPDALWKIVHDRCVPDQFSRNDPAPCTEVNLLERWALYKDDNGATQFLLIPTDRATGIEDPFILTEQAPNYWQAAWTARRFVDQRAAKNLRNDEIALAINSQLARSQNQLHIHIDCIRPDVRDALRRIQAQIGATWMRSTVLGQEFDVRSMTADDLRRKNVFALVANHLQPGQTMAAETIVLAGAVLSDGTNGFDLLVGRVGVGGNRGGGELLEDHGCAVAKLL
jgi:CDP-diacylglycerol pyrophosphatase